MNESAKILSHRDLQVWQKSFALSKKIYELTSSFPSSEQYGMTSQLRRCSVSIPANIAEGRGRFSKTEFAHFISIAYGSAAELDTLIMLAQELKYLSVSSAQEVLQELDQISRMLNKLRMSLKT